MAEKRVHPYIPNSNPKVRDEMLNEIGVNDVDELYSDIPEELRLKRNLDLPEPLTSEAELKKHVYRILAKNKTCEEYISFLGGGCYNHYVPAICDEINGRSEFLTAYAGEPYEDHGRFQALFEYESLMAELLDFDVVNVPTYDWTQAASTSMRMACRITGRNEILIADTVSPDRLSAIRNYIQPLTEITLVQHDPESGLVDIEDLKSKLNRNPAGFYFENPSYLGIIEARGQEIADLLHEKESLLIVGTEPISLGVLKPPSQYGADIACGDIQSLGMHMYFGGALAGFISSRDEERFVNEYPSRLFGITTTEVEGEWGFDDVAYGRTSFAVREQGKEFVGTAAALWGITAGVYLSLMGPRGMEELGKHILQKSQYTARRLSGIEGIRLRFQTPFFKEFVLEFDKKVWSVSHLNQELLGRGIFGGKDLSSEFADLKNCALYCVTEMVSKADIDFLLSNLEQLNQQ